jgi:prepilin-type N-terminal cleavage/methylation domain-containing protein
MNLYKQKRSEGFTIIEVLIVLAIAGLILLIVFLAVPALQRNSRNTQRNNDVAGVLGVINEYASNQNGNLPTQICPNGTTLSIGGGGNCTNPNPTNPVTVTVSGQFTTFNISAVPNPLPATATAGTLQIYTGATCNGNALAAGSGRSIAAWYVVEPNVTQCKSS